MDLFQRGSALSRREKRFATFAEVSALGVDAATFHREGGRDEYESLRERVDPT